MERREREKGKNPRIYSRTSFVVGIDLEESCFLIDTSRSLYRTFAEIGLTAAILTHSIRHAVKHVESIIDRNARIECNRFAYETIEEDGLTGYGM